MSIVNNVAGRDHVAAHMNSQRSGQYTRKATHNSRHEYPTVNRGWIPESHLNLRSYCSLMGAGKRKVFFRDAVPERQPMFQKMAPHPGRYI